MAKQSDREQPCPDGEAGCVITHSRPHKSSRMTWALRVLNAPFTLLQELCRKHEITRLESVFRITGKESWYLELDKGKGPGKTKFSGASLAEVVETAHDFWIKEQEEA